MGQKRPYVQNDDTGLMEVLQPGDSIVSPDISSYKNADGTDHVAGEVVYITTTATEVKRAQADASSTMPAIAVAVETVADGETGAYQTDGDLTLTDNLWKAVNEGGGSLVAGTLYFVSEDNAGKITSDPPDTAGEFIQGVLRAISTTQVKLCFEPYARAR